MERRHWNKSWLLSKILDHVVFGTQEVLDIRRRNVLLGDCFRDPGHQMFLTGSAGEGFFQMPGSDTDAMIIMPEIVALYSETYPEVAANLLNKTVLFLREADCQPGYVALEMTIQGEKHVIHGKDMILLELIKTACVPFQNAIFISSDILRQAFVDLLTRFTGIPFHSNGPCASIRSEKIGMVDMSCAVPCLNWPHEAYAWICRTRVYGWPPNALINKIVQGGCHVVPVGDKCSEDTFLQWRVSFVTAERHLLHSLNHSQTKVYALMKYFLRQTHNLLRFIVKEDEILSSYFVKTIIFYAVENSPPSLWQDNHTFTCFQFCLSILIDWVRSGYCPHYFIPQNNLFLRKVCGQNQQKLLQALLEVQGMKWDILSVARPRVFFCIGNILKGLERGETSYLDQIYPSPGRLEFTRDITMYSSTVFTEMPRLTSQVYSKINKVTNALLESQTNKDEFVLFRFLLECLARVAKDIYAQNITSGGNKQAYKEIKKCKHLLEPLASLCTSPGKLYLATFHYLVGNYSKALQLCKLMTSSSRIFIDNPTTTIGAAQYFNTFCGKGYSWYRKCDGFAYPMFLEKQFCPHELLLEAGQQSHLLLVIPPLPYALFLTFLCHYHLGDIRQCRESLTYLERTWKELLHGQETVAGGYENREGVHWIVYSLLGICYQYVGDYSMAITAFSNSLKAGPMHNPGKERMAMTYLIMCYQNQKI